MFSHWSLSDSKSPQVSRTLLSILAYLNNVALWMVSIRPLISKSSSPFNNSLVTLPLLLLLLLLLYSLRVFQTSVSWWSFTGVWVTACLLRIPAFFTEFRPISIMLWFGWCRVFVWFPILLVFSFSNPWRLFQVHQLQMVSPSPSYSKLF